MNTTLAWLAVQTARLDSTPPVQCQLVDGIKKGTGTIVGNVLGLQDLGPWIVGVLVVALIVCAVIPKIRRFLISHILWVLGVLILASVAVGAVLIFVPNHCG